MSKVDYGCQKCGRQFSSEREQALKKAQSKARCMFCGGALEFPAELKREPSTAGYFDPDTPVDYSCSGCKRAMTASMQRVVDLICAQRPKTCNFCGEGLVFPPEVDQLMARLASQGVVAIEVDMPCILCARTVQGALGERADDVRCRYCTATFRPPLEEGGEVRPLPAQGTLATADQARRLAGEHQLDDLLRDVLVARAERGELALAECERTVDALARVQRWPRVPALDLPLAIEEAAEFVPRVFFGDQAFTSLKVGAGVELVHVLQQTKDGGHGNLLVNTVGLVSLFGLGAGVFRVGGDGEREINQQRLRVSIQPFAGGVGLTFATQWNAETPRAVGADLSSEFSSAIPVALAKAHAYFASFALFGDRVRGSQAFAIAPAAAAARLRALGLAAQADQVAQRFTPTNPAALG